jgi:hypothetical protein
VNGSFFSYRPICVVSGLLAVLVIYYTSCSGHAVKKGDVERAHGVRLPESARRLQQIRVGGPHDYSILSMFTINETEVEPLLGSLRIIARTSPAKTGPGDPLVSGWNVWPEGSATFVPGSHEFENLRRTWKGAAIPRQMLSCASSKGDWLHVEIWKVHDGVLIKLCTTWD